MKTLFIALIALVVILVIVLIAIKAKGKGGKEVMTKPGSQTPPSQPGMGGGQPGGQM